VSRAGLLGPGWTQGGGWGVLYSCCSPLRGPGVKQPAVCARPRKVSFYPRHSLSAFTLPPAGPHFAIVGSASFFEVAAPAARRYGGWVASRKLQMRLRRRSVLPVFLAQSLTANSDARWSLCPRESRLPVSTGGPRPQQPFFWAGALPARRSTPLPSRRSTMRAFCPQRCCENIAEAV
jgi:hypothetical protein